MQQGRCLHDRNGPAVNVLVRPDVERCTSRMPRPRESSARRLLPTCTASNSSGKRCPDSMMLYSPSSCSPSACSPDRHRLSARAPAPSHVIGCRRLAGRVGKRKQCDLLRYCAALQQLWSTRICGKRAVWSPCCTVVSGALEARRGRGAEKKGGLDSAQ